MRVLLAADFYPPSPGGLEAHVRRLAHALARCGDEVAVVAGGGTGATADGDVPVHRSAGALARLPGAYERGDRAFHPPWPDPVFVRSVRDLARRFRPDVVHAHGWCAFSAATACARRIPLVVTLHDYGLRCPKKNLLRGDRECPSGRGLACLRCPGAEQGGPKRTALSAALAVTVPRLRDRVACFVAVSGHVAARHVRLDAGGPPVEVIPNFLDLPTQTPPPAAGCDVLYVGTAERHKGLAVLLAAAARLPAGLARLVVVGTPADTVSRLAAAAAAPAPAGAGGLPVVTPGSLSGEALWARYRDAAVVAVPSIWPEPCPTVALEALAWGRPVVASAAGGLPELVVDGQTGLLVPPADPRALAEAITALLADPVALAIMGRRARASAAQFGTEAVVGQIQDVYEKARVDWCGS